MVMIFPAKLDHLPKMIEFIKNQAREAGFDPHITAKIELAAEEALVNIINYSYPQVSGEIRISCLASNPLAGLKIIICDKGLPFDPLNYKTKNKFSQLDEKEIGGYGINLILQVMDFVDYKRTEDGNQLSFIKYL